MFDRFSFKRKFDVKLSENVSTQYINLLSVTSTRMTFEGKINLSW